MKYEEVQAMNRASRRRTAKANHMAKIPGTTKPYTKPVKRRK